MERPQNLRLLIIAIAILLPSFVLAQSVGISDNPITPDPQSILELKTTTKGVLLPRLNTGEIATLTGSPLALSDKGLTVFNTSTNRYNVWDGSQWIVLAASTPGTGDFIINDVAQQTGADFNIDGNGTMADLAITGGDITSSGLLRIGSTTDVRIRLDTDANGSEEFQITNNGGTTPVFTVTEAGNLDAKGSGTFEGDLNLIGAGRTLAAETNFDITGESGIDIIIDSDNNSTNTSFRIQKDASTDLLEIQEDGDMIVPGLFGTGSNLIQANGTGQLSRSSIDPTDLITGTGSPTQLAYFDATQNIVSDADLFW